MNSDTLRNQYRTIHILWLAMLASLAVYAAVCHLAGDSIRQGIGEGIPLDLIRNILIGISAAELAAIQLIRKKILTIQKGMEQQAVIRKYFFASFMSYTVSESIGVFGLFLYFLGSTQETLYSFIGISALAMFWHRPVYEDLEDLVKKGL
ncbi:MAG: hypothetical protein AB7S75_11475 [Desulfococcaceae bacterium]